MSLFEKSISTLHLPHVIAVVGMALICSCALADESKSSGSSSGSASSGCGNKQSMFSKDELTKIAKEVHGDKYTCYMKLYDAETSSNPACEQQNVPNPPGMGLCTLEGDATKRKARGGACAVDNSEMDGNNEEGIKNQMKCCAEIMEKSGSQYFQPVKEGKVDNCATSAVGG